MVKSLVDHDELMKSLKALGQRFAVKETEHVSLAQAMGRVLAEKITSPFNIPRFDNAAVDGFAFLGALAESNGGRLPVVGRLAAGDQLIEGHQVGAFRVFTGAILPSSIDRVAMQEDCTVVGNQVKVPLTLKAGDNCRRIGEDVHQGQIILDAGTRLKMADIASLAATGRPNIKARRLLNVAVLSSGKEIISPGQAVSDTSVYDANQPALISGLRCFPVDVTRIDHVPDVMNAACEKLKQATAMSDLVIVTGGASLGEEDHIFSVLQKLGEVFVRRIKVKPGRPLTVGRIDDSLVMSLPGNPVAAMVCFMVYVRALMLSMLSCDVPSVKPYLLDAAFERQKKPGRHEFWRGIRLDDGRINVYPHDGSGLISSLRASHGLIEMPASSTSVKVGDKVLFLPYEALLS